MLLANYPSLPFYLIAGILLVCSVIIYLYRNNGTILSRGRIVNEEQQTLLLINNFQKIIEKIEYRDKVLIKERNYAKQANKAKSDFLVKMSHELRTPMHAILNFAEMGREETRQKEFEKLNLYFSRIEESGERLLRLINNLLDLTKLESGQVDFKFTENNIIECINYVHKELSSLMTKKGITLNVINTSQKNIFLFDKDTIIRVIINLLSNAIKFSPENSDITIRVSTVDIKKERKYSYLQVSVEDKGSGIKEEELEIIFHKFIQGTTQSGKDIGSGLGLAICKEIITAHKGKIWADNLQGEGAKINFIISEQLS